MCPIKVGPFYTRCPGVTWDDPSTGDSRYLRWISSLSNLWHKQISELMMSLNDNIFDEHSRNIHHWITLYFFFIEKQQKTSNELGEMKGIYFSKCSHNSIHIHDRCEFQQLARLKIKNKKLIRVCSFTSEFIVQKQWIFNWIKDAIHTVDQLLSQVGCGWGGWGSFRQPKINVAKMYLVF